MGTYEFYPNIVVAANRNKDVVGGLKYWSAITSYDVGGKYITSKSAREMLMETFDIRVRNSYKIIANFNGILWDVYNGTDISNPGEMRVYTPDEVAQHYGLRNAGYCEERDIEELLQDNVSAYMYKALLETKVEASSPITRSTLKTLTGVGIRSQQLYHTLLNIPARPNYIVQGAYASVGLAREDFLENDLVVGPHRIATIHVKHPQRSLVMHAILKQVGNTYNETYTPSAQSNLEYLGTASGKGIWIEKKLCTSLHTHITGNITITGVSTAITTTDHPFELASTYENARRSKYMSNQNRQVLTN